MLSITGGEWQLIEAAGAAGHGQELVLTLRIVHPNF